MNPLSGDQNETPPEQRFFCLRFDVDTDLCLRRGMPALLELAETAGCPFTFFVNPGRAVSYRVIARRLFGKDCSDASRAPSLPPRHKLGVGGIVRLLLTNPPLLPRRADIVRAAANDGHEIGLHGGRNHGAWQADAHSWSQERLIRELGYGIKRLRSATGTSPRSFASPAWNSPAALPRILADHGFDVLADEHGTSFHPYTLPGSGIISTPTVLAGEPGGVGFLECQRARGLGEEQILAATGQKMASDTAIVCMYDHPFFAGIQEIELLRKLIRQARAQGRLVTTLGDATRRLAKSQ